MGRRSIELPVEAIDEYGNGSTARTLAAKYGFHEASVLRWLRRNKVTVRRAGAHPKATTTELRNKVVAEWNKEQSSMAQIGAKFAIPRTSVGRLLSEAREMGAYVYIPSDKVIAVRNLDKHHHRRGQNHWPFPMIYPS